MARSVRPTTVKLGSPWAMSASTRIGTPASPWVAQLMAQAITQRSVAPHRCVTTAGWYHWREGLRTRSGGARPPERGDRLRLCRQPSQEHLDLRIPLRSDVEAAPHEPDELGGHL